MRTLIFVLVVCYISVATLCAADYMGVTKRELVRRLGLPAEITLPTEAAPSQEIWVYYWQDGKRRLQVADFHFRGNIVCGYASDFDAKRLISTETSAGFERVYRYKVQADRSRYPR